MKKILNYTLSLLAGASLFASCAKEVLLTDSTANGNAGSQAETVISASLEGLKVSIVPTLPGSGAPVPTGATLTWESTDQLRVYNHADKTQYSDFRLISGEGTKTATFSGAEIAGATAYDIEILNGIVDFGEQTQPADGDPGDLKYFASATNVADLSSISLSDFSSILALTAKMPSQAIAAGVKSVEIEASEDIFNAGNTLKVTFDAVGSEDEYLNFYATLPAGSTAVPAGTTLLVKFNAPETEHTVYTRFMSLPASTFTTNKVNKISVDASNSASYANASSTGIGTSANPYLIGDPYQLDSVNVLLADEVRYFKLIDDIDMEGHTMAKMINRDSPYRPFDFDGNDMTISNLNQSLFYNLVGASVKDLTLDHCTVTSRAILAEYCQGSGNTVSNVTISNGSINSNNDNTGALIGRVNNGTAAETLTVTISDCTVEDTDVAATGVVGGVIGFADAKVAVSGCVYTGGTVTCRANRFAGGFLASTGNYDSVFSDCQVADATVDVTVTNNDFRAGGFAGQLQTKVLVKGCTVGSSAEKVNLVLAAPTSGKLYNAGGFAGTAYGTITKNGDTRSAAFVNISSGNTVGNAQINIGGFTGYSQGRTEYSDADITATSVTGSHVGGFVGICVNGSIENCTATGAVSGTQKTGGFVGVASNGAITSCTASTAVSKVGSATGSGEGVDFGVFAGMIAQDVTMSKCSATADISVNASYVGGFAGSISTSASKTSVISKCWSTGNVTTGSSQCGSFIGHIAANVSGTVTVSDCYSTGNQVSTNQRQGGFIGQINSGIVTVSNCYAAGTVTGSFAIGGLVGFMNVEATIENCAAWNSGITPSSYGDGNWSSGAVVGVAWPSATLSNNYRKPGMSLTAWWVPDADYNHPDVSSSATLVVKDKADGTLRNTSATATASGNDNYPQFAYHGKVAAGTTLSQLASTTLGWSSDVWDFSGDLPVLK